METEIKRSRKARDRLGYIRYISVYIFSGYLQLTMQIFWFGRPHLPNRIV